MKSSLIELSDGILVEVEVPDDHPMEFSGGSADKVNATIQKIQPILISVCNPVVIACKEISKEVCIEQTEIELGLSFEVEGNLYLTKSKASANLKIKLIIKS